MTPKTRMEYTIAIQTRYRKASKAYRHIILNEYCAATGYARKYAIAKLNGPPAAAPKPFRKRRRDYTYSEYTLQIIGYVWEAAGYPCSERLKAILPAWLPWIRLHFKVNASTEQQMLHIGARSLDYRLRKKKSMLKSRIYGRTKPGTLLKHHIPIKTDHWDVTAPGWTEIDTVSHSGDCADGVFANTVNQTDIFTTWVESRAVLGKSEAVVTDALDEMHEAMPFEVRGVDSDNGSEFVNWHLYRYCQDRGIQFTRGRPYKKNDNAHIEQKNWTHVRKLMGYERYDTGTAVSAMNKLYTQELRLFMNLFLPSMKLVKKTRIGSKQKRVYDNPQTPFERLLASGKGDKGKIVKLEQLRRTLDPFELAKTIEKKLEAIYRLANRRQSPKKRQI
ncbi:MAG: integrase [Candidatus Marinimicrobia bacterium]|nr:integrase [Candidatus Neomarinimicrobiota bacterium]